MRLTVGSKLEKHKEALSILVNQLQDSITAEAYCSLGGQVIPPKVATAIGEGLGLTIWTSLVAGRMRPQRSSSNLSTSALSVNIIGGIHTPNVGEQERTKHLLTSMLLEVYMNAGEAKAGDAARLLNAQAINLEASDVPLFLLFLS